MSTIWTVEADLDRDGTFETDLTPYVPDFGAGWSITRGIDREGVYQASTAAIDVDNTGGEFTPDNVDGLFYGQLVENPDAPIRITGEVNATTYTAWAGYLHDLEVIDPGGGMGIARLICRDMGQIIAEAPRVYIAVSTSRTVTDALEAIADYIGIPPAGQQFDADTRVLPFHFAVGMDAMDALMDVVRSSFGGILFIDALGRLRYVAPGNRLGTAGAAMWGDGTDIIPSDKRYQANRFDFVTEALVRSTVFYEGQTNVDMFRTGFGDVPFTLAANEVWTRSFDLGAFVSFVSPVADTDYQANDAADFSGTDRTADLTVTATDTGTGRMNLTLENGHAGTVYVRLRIRGVPFNFHAERPEATASMPVGGALAGSPLEADIPYGDATGTEAMDYAVQLLRTYRQTFPRVDLLFEHTTEAIAEAMLAAELSDLVWFDDRALGARGLFLADWWRIAALSLTWRPTGVASTVVTLIPADLARDIGAIAYDEFDRANGSGDLGTSTSLDTWTGDSGFDIASGAARANSDSLQTPVLSPAGGTDLIVGVAIGNISSGDEVGLTVRWQDSSNYYRAYLDKGSNEVIIERVVAGAVTELASPAFTVGTSHELMVKAQDDRLRVYIDGVRRIDVTDSAVAGAGAGLMARNANASATFTHYYAQAVS